MTKKDLVEQLAQYPDDTVLYAFNGDDEMVMPVTGLLYTPPVESLDHPRAGPKVYKPPTLEFCTDEP